MKPWCQNKKIGTICLLVFLLLLQGCWSKGCTRGKAEKHFKSGLAKRQKVDYVGAIEDYTKAIELKPDYASAYNNRGVAYEKVGKFKQAIENYRKSLAIDPNYSTPKNNLNNLLTVLIQKVIIPLP